MGQIASQLTRPFRNFNVDQRAVKVLERRQKVAVPPPYYPSTVEKLSRFKSEHPEFLQAQKEKNEILHENLKKVYVESKSDSVQAETSTKPFPLNRKPPPEGEMGAFEVTSDVREGHASLKTIFAFIGQHRSDPQNVTAKKIAKELKLDENDVENVLHHFKLLQLHLPKEMFEKNKKLKKLVEDQMDAAAASKDVTFFVQKRPEEISKPQIDKT